MRMGMVRTEGAAGPAYHELNLLLVLGGHLVSASIHWEQATYCSWRSLNPQQKQCYLGQSTGRCRDDSWDAGCCFDEMKPGTEPSQQATGPSSIWGAQAVYVDVCLMR
jgi:hypothetical protein